MRIKCTITGVIVGASIALLAVQPTETIREYIEAYLCILVFGILGAIMDGIMESNNNIRRYEMKKKNNGGIQ